MTKEWNNNIRVNDLWYNVDGQQEKASPRNSIDLGNLVPRDKQTAITRLKAGVLKTMKYKNKIKTFEQCPVHLVTADRDHILECLDIKKQDIYDNPLLVANVMSKHKHVLELV